MIVKYPTVDELLHNFGNLREATAILIKGLQEKQDPEYVLYLWDKFRRQDNPYPKN